jgi:hypothetical protein
MDRVENVFRRHENSHVSADAVQGLVAVPTSMVALAVSNLTRRSLGSRQIPL